MQLEDGLAPAGRTTAVCSLLCAAILTWGCFLNWKIGSLYWQKPCYNSFSLSGMSPMQRTKKWLCHSCSVQRFLQKKGDLRLPVLTYQTKGPWPMGAPIAGMPHVACPHNQLWRTMHPLEEYMAAFNPRKNFSSAIPAWVWHAPVPREVPDAGAGAALVPPCPASGWAGTGPGCLALPSPTMGSWDRGWWSWGWVWGPGPWPGWGQPSGAGVAPRDMMENRQVGRRGCIL